MLQTILNRMSMLLPAAVLAAFAAAGLIAPAPARADSDDWPMLHSAVFQNREIIENDGTVVIDAPGQADDGALVPITVRVPPEVNGPLKSLTIVLDKNPVPVVAQLHFGPAAGEGGEKRFSTRVRVDSFSHIRAVVETADGKLHMTTDFIAAAGGCAAMNAKDPAVLAEGLGKTIVKTFPPALESTPIWEAQVMLKHPNFSGYQINPDTGKMIPPRFVEKMVVKRDGELVFALDGTPSISANPYFRFTFGRGDRNGLDVTMTDTDGTVFQAQSKPSGS